MMDFMKFDALCDELERWQSNYNHYCDLYYATDSFIERGHYEYLMRECQKGIESVEKRINRLLTW